jgi:hypothetical protein
MVLLPLFFVSFFALLAGMDASSDWFVYHAAGETAMCQVTGVRKEVTTVRMPPDHGRTRTSHDVHYMHTTVCPHATYTIDRVPPYPVGTRAEVTYDPRGRADPVFSDDIPSMHKFGVVLLSVGAATILLIPFIAWALGRWRPAAMSPAALSRGTPVYGAPPPSAYIGRRRPPEPDARLQAMADEIMAARGMSRILKIMKVGMILRRRPPWPPGPPMGPPPVS